MNEVGLSALLVWNQGSEAGWVQLVILCAIWNERVLVMSYRCGLLRTMLVATYSPEEENLSGRVDQRIESEGGITGLKLSTVQGCIANVDETTC